MNNSSKAIMFLATKRGHTETDWYRSYATFGDKATSDVQRPAFGNLYQLNDDTLAGGHSVELIAEKNTSLVIIPVVGAIAYRQQDNKGDVQAGAIAVFSVAAGQTIQLSNPYKNELVNYLQLWFSTDSITDTSPALYAFDLDAAGNQFINIFGESGHSKAPGLPATISIGKFAGRAEAVYSIGENNGLFVLVLQGAFEVQYRLLESRDGLALWDVAEVEAEALSNEAILLLVEVVL